MERRVGFEIVGAGDASVNGIYEPGLLPHYMGPPTWRKRGTSLFMFRWARTQWYLARIALDEPHDGHITDDWFLSNRIYVAPSGNPPCDEPPSRGWVPVRGTAPGPRCHEAFLPVLHDELPPEEVGTNLSLLPSRHFAAPLCPVAAVEFEDSDLTLCGTSTPAGIATPGTNPVRSPQRFVLAADSSPKLRACCSSGAPNRFRPLTCLQM